MDSPEQPLSTSHQLTFPTLQGQSTRGDKRVLGPSIHWTSSRTFKNKHKKGKHLQVLKKKSCTLPNNILSAFTSWSPRLQCQPNEIGLVGGLSGWLPSPPAAKLALSSPGWTSTSHGLKPVNPYGKPKVLRVHQAGHLRGCGDSVVENTLGPRPHKVSTPPNYLSTGSEAFASLKLLTSTIHHFHALKSQVLSGLCFPYSTRPSRPVTPSETELLKLLNLDPSKARGWTRWDHKSLVSGASLWRSFILSKNQMDTEIRGNFTENDHLQSAG